MLIQIATWLVQTNSLAIERYVKVDKWSSNNDWNVSSQSNLGQNMRRKYNRWSHDNISSLTLEKIYSSVIILELFP